ncbi:MAG: IS3 family transposase [Chlamydiales bacterium]
MKCGIGCFKKRAGRCEAGERYFKKGRGHLLKPQKIRFEFMQAHSNEFPIKKMAKIFGVSRSGYYAYLARPSSSREKENCLLFLQIKSVYQENRQLYGSPRIHAALQKQGMSCSRKRVARLMNAHGIRAMVCKKKPHHKRVITEAAPNLLKQDFSAHAPNMRWSGDISYIKSDEGWLYLAVILDLFSRKVVSFSIGNHMKTELVKDTLQKARFKRAPSSGLVHHSDRGSQYTSHVFKGFCMESGVVLSMNSGSCYDNAAIESCFHTLKTELIYLKKFRTKREARMAIFEYIEVFYNRKRLHSALGYKSPKEFEQEYWENKWKKKICV